MSSPPASERRGGDRKPVGTLSQWQLMARRFRRHRVAAWSGYLLLVLYLVAVLSELVAVYPATWRDVRYAYCPPQLPRWSFTDGLHVRAMTPQQDPITFQKSYAEDRTHVLPLRFFARGEPYRLWGLVPMDRHLVGLDMDRIPESEDSPRVFFLGADKYGRDLFSRIVHGSRISLSVGLVGIAVTFVLGLAIGGVSGYAGGATDTFIQRVIEVINSFPHLPLWLALAAVMPPDWSPLHVYLGITVVLSLLGWTGLARVVRGKLLALREEDYVMAARLLGASHGRIIGHHLLPGFSSHIIVTLTLSVPGMILGETALSFLGLGLRPPVVSWGVLLQDCMNMTTVSTYPWLLLPVFFVVITVLCFNFFGDGLRDAADPYAVR